MLEVLTRSGVAFSIDPQSPHRNLLMDIASDALGGVVVSAEIEPGVDAVTAIIEQSVTGSTLTTEGGKTFRLLPEGWLDEVGQLATLPPTSEIVSATMPGGWTWSR